MLLKARTARHKRGGASGACSVVALVEAVALRPPAVIRRITSYPGVMHLPVLPLRETRAR
jgi:hypothetical protein